MNLICVCFIRYFVFMFLNFVFLFVILCKNVVSYNEEKNEEKKKLFNLIKKSFGVFIYDLIIIYFFIVGYFVKKK